MEVLVLLLIVMNAAAVIALRAEIRGAFGDDTDTLVPALRRGKAHERRSASR
jgi:hypothetical protein